MASDLILQSNNTSVILRSLSESEQHDLSYFTQPSYPLLAKETYEIQSRNNISGPPASKEVTFDLNKSKILRNLMIKTTYTIAAITAELATPAYGLTIFERVEWRSNNKIIGVNTDGYILARAQCGTISQAISKYKRALPLNPTNYKCATVASDLTKVVFTPLEFSFFDSPNNNLDLGFWEQQTIVARFASTEVAGLVQEMTGATCTLICDTYVPDQKAYDMLRAENNNPSKPLNMLTVSSFQETLPLTSSTTTTIRLNINYPVLNTYFYIRNISGTAPATYSPAIAWCQDYNTYSFSIGGRSMVMNLDRLTGTWENDRSGGSCGIIPIGVTGSNPVSLGLASNKVTVLPWGLMSMNHTDVTGALAFNSLNSPTLSVTYDNNASFADFELVVVHEYFQMLIMDSSNSAIQVIENH